MILLIFKAAMRRFNRRRYVFPIINLLADTKRDIDADTCSVFHFEDLKDHIQSSLQNLNFGET